MNNLICFDSVSKKQQAITPGFHSLCNGALDDIWPKMALGENKLANTVQSFEESPLLIDGLFNLMQNTQQAKKDTLPNTGVPLDWEKRLSSIFIVSPEYGTRTTNILLQDNEGKITIYDRSYNELGYSITKQCFSI